MNIHVEIPEGTEQETLDTDPFERFRARNYLACDLLLARLYRNHPDHAMAALKGVEPRVVDLEPPAKPAPAVAPLPSSAMEVGPAPPISLIVDQVGWFYGVPAADIIGRKNDKKTIFARGVSMYIAKKWGKRDNQIIATKIGGRHRSIVRLYVQKMHDRIEHGERLRDEIDVIKLHIKQAMLNRAGLPS